MKTKTTKAISALDAAIAMSGDWEGKRPDEFTNLEYADRMGLHAEVARRILNKMVKEEQLVRRDSKKGKFYSLPK